jgi:cyclophilin family peptidyl-prolyl cis-trans isomerase
MGSGGGTRGARGQGWLINYRAGKGGRHLQGDYAHLDVDTLHAWNDAVMSLGSTQAYMDVKLEDVGSTTNDDRGDDNSMTDANVDETTDNTKNARIKHRLTFELATAVLPLATQNFMKLLEAEPGIGYNGSTLHRVEKQVGLSGGLVWNPSLFPDEDNIQPKRRGYKVIGRCHPSLTMPTSATNMDVSSENLVLSHLPGVITMLSPRVHEIDSRFMLCSRHAPHLDGQTVAIGRLSKDSLEIVQEWESTLITSYGTPTNVTLRIVECGVLGETPAATTDDSFSTQNDDVSSAESEESKKKVTEP